MTNKSACFQPKVRLTLPSEFKHVFAKAERSSDQYFTVLAKNNNLTYPRLGLAIAKKNISRAVDRNKIKRAARESFRLQQTKIIPLDIVVMARREAASTHTKILQTSLAKHWLKLNQRCAI